MDEVGFYGLHTVPGAITHLFTIGRRVCVSGAVLHTVSALNLHLVLRRMNE